MKFCKICNSLYHLQHEGDLLMLFCKRCGHIDKIDDGDNTVCIKLTDNSESYSTSNIRNNKNIFKDPSLPRVDNSIVKCINNKCLSNLSKTDIYINGLLPQDGIITTEDSEQLKSIFNDFGVDDENINIIINDEIVNLKLNINSRDKRRIIQKLIIKDLKKINEKEITINLSCIAIIYGLNIKDDDLIDYLCNKYDLVKDDLMINFDSTSNQNIFTINNINISDYNIIINKINENKSFVFKDYPCVLNINYNNEIVYIKYDKINLKYIYMCSICNSSWINNIKVNN